MELPHARSVNESEYSSEYTAAVAAAVGSYRQTMILMVAASILRTWHHRN